MKSLIKKIVDIATLKKEGHIPSSLSILDIIYVLYDKVLDIDSIKENRIDRDRFILSKGHASLGLYIILDHFGLLKEDINTFCDLNSKLGGHPTDKIDNVESSTGSLGHGFPIGVGLALAYKINHSTDRAVELGDLDAKFKAFGWDTKIIDGHNQNEILLALNNRSDKPTCIIANTIKGKGIEMIENNPEWHHKFPNEEEYKLIINNLK